MRLGRAPQTSTARLPLVTDNAETALMAGSRQNPFAFAWTAQGKGVVAAYHKPVFFPKTDQVSVVGDSNIVLRGSVRIAAFNVGKGARFRFQVRYRPCTPKSRLVSSGWSMSLPPKADICQRIEHVCFVP